MNDNNASLRSLDMELEERAELLSETARKLPELSLAERQEQRTRVLAFLRDEIGAHLLTDQRLLYPKVAERLGDPLAPAPMNYEHRAIRWWTDEIVQADVADTAELQRLLYGVLALIKLHLSREEDLYLGALDSPAWPAVR
jgi:Hemerythrin HHE cation binding domain